LCRQAAQVDHERVTPGVVRPRRTWGVTRRWPVLKPLAVRCFTVQRRIQWRVSGTSWADQQAAPLPYVVAEHASPLLRQLGASEMWLQHNKVVNLRLAAPAIDGLVVHPGETFSFCRRVGNATRRRGYLVGMTLEGGEVHPGVGGGLCQIANLLHWLVLHSDLTVTQRSEHTVDPFPDDNRSVPWGTGCSIAWNYVDLQLRNDTDLTYQLMVRVGETHLIGELRANSAPPRRYRVESRQDAFEQVGGTWWRSNEIWRIEPDTGAEALLWRNHARTMYVPDQP
jgi:vancomycin resistance protein VanW